MLVEMRKTARSISGSIPAIVGDMSFFAAKFHLHRFAVGDKVVIGKNIAVMADNNTGTDAVNFAAVSSVNTDHRGHDASDGGAV